MVKGDKARVHWATLTGNTLQRSLCLLGCRQSHYWACKMLFMELAFKEGLKITKFYFVGTERTTWISSQVTAARRFVWIVFSRKKWYSLVLKAPGGRFGNNGYLPNWKGGVHPSFKIKIVLIQNEGHKHLHPKHSAFTVVSLNKSHRIHCCVCPSTREGL